MPARGKPGKPRAGFPPLPQSLESPQTRRPSDIPPASTANTYIGEKEASTASRPGLKPSHSRVGQNKLPKWAKIRLFHKFDAVEAQNRIRPNCFMLLERWHLPRAIRNPFYQA